MPRQIDLFPQNLQVNSNPTNRLGVTSAQINHLQDQIPAAQAAAQALALNAFLTALDKATGLNLVLWSQELQSLFSQTAADNLLASFQSWLVQTQQDASAAWTALQDFFATGDWSDLSAAWTDLLRIIFGSSFAPSVVGSISAPVVTNTPTNAQPVSNFPNAASLQPGGGWSYDSSVSSSSSGGSVKFTGTTGALRGVVASVQTNQIVALSAVLQWSGATYSGSNPFQLQLIPWNGATPGTPVVVAQMAGPAASGSWTALSGTYTVPAGVSAVQMRLFVQNMTAGSVWWDACTTTISGGFLSILQNDLNELQNDAQAANAATQTFLQAIQTAIAHYTDWTTFITTIEAAYQTWAAVESGLVADEFATLKQMLNSLLGLDPTTGQYPATQVQGVGGLQDLIATFDNMWNTFITSLEGDLAALGLSQVGQLLNGLLIQSGTTQTLATDTANTVATVTNRPLVYGLDSTTESNIAFSSATLATSNVTSPTSVLTFVRCAQTDAKGTVAFIANRVSGATLNVNVNIYKCDFTHSVLDYVATAVLSNAMIGSSQSWYFTSASQTPVAPGDVLAIEFQSITSPGLTLWGTTEFSTTPNHPVANLPAMAATRSAGTSTPSGTIAFSALTFTNAFVPYVGLETTNPPAPKFFPQTNPFTANGSYTMQSWTNFVDLVAVGDGGGGEGELGAATGYGGTAGSWATRTLHVGVDIHPSTVFTITIGTGGTGGPYFTAGGDGAGVTIAWTDILGNPQSMTAAGGFGGNHTFGLSHNTLGVGLSPGNITYQSKTYFGGAEQFNNYPGNAPGGAGAGASFFQYGTAGAPGQAWIVDRQT